MAFATSLTDSIKVTTYEILALLFPGSLIVEVARRGKVLDGLGDMSGLMYAGVAYGLGLGLQGLCAFAFSALERRWQVRVAGARAAALAIAQTKAPSLTADHLVSYCLSRPNANRVPYDKFVALRDMARGLVAAALVSGVALCAWGHVAWGLSTFGLCAGFFERYATWAPLPEETLFTQLLAVELPVTASAETGRANAHAQG